MMPKHTHHIRTHTSSNSVDRPTARTVGIYCAVRKLYGIHELSVSHSSHLKVHKGDADTVELLWCASSCAVKQPEHFGHGQKYRKGRRGGGRQMERGGREAKGEGRERKGGRERKRGRERKGGREREGEGEKWKKGEKGREGEGG